MTPEQLAAYVKQRTDLFTKRLGLECDCAEPRPMVGIVYNGPAGRIVRFAAHRSVTNDPTEPRGASGFRVVRVAPRAFELRDSTAAEDLLGTCPRCASGYLVIPDSDGIRVVRLSPPTRGTVTPDTSAPDAIP